MVGTYMIISDTGYNNDTGGVWDSLFYSSLYSGIQ